MALWFKEKQKAERTLGWNKKQLQSELSNLSTHIYAHRDEIGLAIIKEVIELARNIQLIESYGNKSPEYAKGRFDAFSDLIAYIERAVEEKRDEIKQGGKKETPHSIHAMGPRRTNNMAKAAI